MTLLRFPAVSRPDVSIVIVTHGAQSVVARALALLAAHSEPIYELIVVDSASPDDTGDWLEAQLAGARLVRSKENIGFGAGSNRGAEHARGKYLLFFNPDVLVWPGWLSPLLDAMRLPRVGAAGPTLRNLDGSVQAAGWLIDRSAGTIGYGAGHDDLLAPGYRFVRSVDYIAGACLMVSRSLFHDASGFDLVYGLGYYEDADLCFRLARMGWRSIHVPSQSVRHMHDVSGGSRTLAETVQRNQHTFAERWNRTLRTRPLHPLEGNPSRVLGARDVRAPLRILVLGDAATSVPALLDHDPRLAITIAAQSAPTLANLVEVVEDVVEWPSWFEQRRHHYDLVVGRDARLDELVDATQPQARRLEMCAPDDLVTNGAPPWPPIS